MSNITLTTGITTNGQFPVDGKVFFNTIAELADLGASDINAYTYYETMRTTVVETALEYVWREESTPGEAGGIVGSSFTYPADVVSDGIDYSNRTFNFFVVASGTSEDLGLENIKTIEEFNALVAAATPGKWLISEDISLTSSKTLPAGVTLEFNSSILDLNGFTLTGNNTKIESEPKQIFTTDGDLSGTWNVDGFYFEWFGAKGDDSTSDSLAIEKSLNYGGSLTKGIKDKVYLLDSQVTIPNTIDIEIDLQGSTLKRKTTYTTAEPVLRSASALTKGIEIKNGFILDDTGVMDPFLYLYEKSYITVKDLKCISTGSLFETFNSSNIKIIDNTLENLLATPLSGSTLGSVYNGSNVVVSGNTTRNTFYSFAVSSISTGVSHDVKVLNNNVFGCESTAIFCRLLGSATGSNAYKGCLIDGNYLENIGKAGIKFTSPGGTTHSGPMMKAIITNNHVRGWGLNIASSAITAFRPDGADITITDLIVSNNVVDAEDTDGNVSTIVNDGNQKGFRFSFINGMTFNGNIALNCLGDGISFDNSSFITAIGNVAKNCCQSDLVGAEAGVYMLNVFDSIIECVSTDNTNGSGIWFSQSRRNRISGVYSNNSEYGVRENSGGATGTTKSGNNTISATARDNTTADFYQRGDTGLNSSIEVKCIDTIGDRSTGTESRRDNLSANDWGTNRNVGFTYWNQDTNGLDVRKNTSWVSSGSGGGAGMDLLTDQTALGIKSFIDGLAIGKVHEGRMLDILGNTIASNEVADIHGVFDFANFAQQGLGSEPTAFIFHHYTDGHQMQVDNVGTGDILRLVNAQNSTRRSDEASDYVGTGDFLKLITTPVGVGSGQEVLMYIDKDGYYNYPRTSDYYKISLNKTDDSNYAFQFMLNTDNTFLVNYDNKFKILTESATNNTFISDRGTRFYVDDNVNVMTLGALKIDTNKPVYFSNGESRILSGTSLSVRDGAVLKIGDGNDWQMNHDGTDNNIDLYNGDLVIRQNTGEQIRFGRATGNIKSKSLQVGTSNGTFTIDSTDTQVDETGTTYGARFITNHEPTVTSSSTTYAMGGRYQYDGAFENSSGGGGVYGLGLASGLARPNVLMGGDFISNYAGTSTSVQNGSLYAGRFNVRITNGGYYNHIMGVKINAPILSGGATADSVWGMYIADVDVAGGTTYAALNIEGTGENNSVAWGEDSKIWQSGTDLKTNTDFIFPNAKYLRFENSAGSNIGLIGMTAGDDLYLQTDESIIVVSNSVSNGDQFKIKNGNSDDLLKLRFSDGQATFLGDVIAPTFNGQTMATVVATGLVIDLSVKESEYNQVTPLTGLTYTFTGSTVGSFAKVAIPSGLASYPTLTGGTLLSSPTFNVAYDYYMFIEYTSTGAEYFFTQK